MRKSRTARLPLIVALTALTITGLTLGLCAPRAAFAQDEESGGTWKDPQEGAFSVETPAGWKLSGGLSRNGESNFRQSVQAFQPENDLIVQIGDSALPPFAVPSPDLLKAGMNQGQMIQANGGAKILLLPLLSAETFNTWYASNRLQPIMDDFKIGVSHKEDDMSQKYTEVMQKVSSMPIKVTVAETSFTGKLKASGKEVGFAVLSVVLYTGAPGSSNGTWLARPIMVGWDRNEQAAESKNKDAAVLEQLMTTWQDNPDWIQQYDEKAAGKPSAGASGTSAGLRASTMGTYWKTPGSRKSAALRMAAFLQHIPEGAGTTAVPPPASNNPFSGLK